MHIFTSVTANYLPKARVLARSVKRYHPDAVFHLLLSDRQPDWLQPGREPFDTIINIEELPRAQRRAWIFKHTVVELCTAVKGFGFQEIFRRHAPEKVLYLDPDIAVMSSLDSILARLDRASLLLTPHQTTPDTQLPVILDNEVCSLKHGVFNLGFLAVRNSGEGHRFLDWWASRLEHFCFDDIPNGLFTDQRWVDLAPCFFPDLQVLHEPIYNVCTWNLSQRIVTGSVPDGLLVNGSPLCFYHFSGFDSGAQKLMLDLYGKQSPVLGELRDWYIDRCREEGQEEFGRTPCCYDTFSNGEKITRLHRYLYRTRPDLEAAFPDPFRADGPDSYSAWFKSNHGAGEQFPDPGNYGELAARYREALADLQAIRTSKSWRILKALGIVNR